VKRPWQFGRYLRLAEELVRRGGLESLQGRASGKLVDTRGTSRLLAIRDDLITLVDLLRAYVRGEYRDVPTRTLLLLVAGVLYFVTPLDAIPDVIPGLGFVDDVTVLTYVLGLIRGEIDRFRALAARSPVPDKAMPALTEPERDDVRR